MVAQRERRRWSARFLEPKALRFEPRITRALKALAEAGKPVTLGTLQ
ncbi:hypothetical protein ACKI1I_41735 [Streptomyces turgidiscabies]